MKKAKKHTFSHKDPEKEASKQSASTKESKNSYSYKEAPYVERDLKMGALTILFLGILLGALYFVQTKTNLLTPLFKYFNL